MPGCFLDTSALVKRYHDEDGTPKVDQLFADTQTELFISRIGFIETQSALATKVRSGQLTADGYDLARKRFLGDIKSRRIMVVRVIAKHYLLAERLIGRHATVRRLRTLDAFQLSVGLDLQAQNRIILFSCADQALCEVAALENLNVLNPLTAT
jgi:uncharacterized protein with PIN domain